MKTAITVDREFYDLVQEGCTMMKPQLGNKVGWVFVSEEDIWFSEEMSPPFQFAQEAKFCFLYVRGKVRGIIQLMPNATPEWWRNVTRCCWEAK